MCELCQKFLADQRSIAAGGAGTHDFLDDPKPPKAAQVKKPVADSSVAGGTDTGLAERDQIIEEFAEMPQAVPQSEWKRLGIGYGPLSGQVFPEACAFELSEIGPQGEPLWRYSEDQPREPNGEFGSGGAATVQSTWKIARGSKEEFDRAVANTPGAEYTAKGLKLDLVRYQKPEQEGEEALRTGVFFLPEKNSPYKAYYSTDKQGYGGGERIEGEKEYINPIITKAGTGGKAPEYAYDAINGKGSYEAMRSDVLSKTVGWNQSVSQKIDAVKEVLTKYGGKPDMASEIVQRSTTGNTLPYAVQEHIVACSVRASGHDAVIAYSKSGGAERLSEVFDVKMDTYPSDKFRAFLLFVEARNLGDSTAAATGDSHDLLDVPVWRYSEDQPRDADGKFGSGGFENKGTVKTTDKKVTTYSSPNHTIVIEHDTKESKVTIKHLDKDDNLLTKQTHDSIGAARKELQSQGIDHKFHALRSSEDRSCAADS